MSIRPSTLALLAALFLGATGCGGDGQAAPPAAAGGQRVVGFAQIGAESSWRSAETASIQDEAGKRGFRLKLADAQARHENQVQAVRGFISQRVDAIILAPQIEDGWDEVLGEAKRAGIPVVLVDRTVKVADPELYATLVASDFVEEGRLAATWLAQRLEGRAAVVELQGTAGSSPAIDRRRGFAEVLAQHPQLTIVKSASGDFTRAKGKEVMQGFIAAARSEGLRIDAVFAHNDDMALGAIQALEAAGLKPGSEVVVVSIDGVRAAFEAMIAGTLNASVECNPLLGPDAFDAIEAVLAGKPLPKRIIITDRVFDQSNAAQALATRSY